jgi:hypothetical protein
MRGGQELGPRTTGTGRQRDDEKEFEKLTTLTNDYDVIKNRMLCSIFLRIIYKKLFLLLQRDETSTENKIAIDDEIGTPSVVTPSFQVDTGSPSPSTN